MITARLRPFFATRARAGVTLGVLTLGLRLLAGLWPSAVEAVYARGFFLGVRWLLDYTIGWCPFPFSYLVILAILGYWAWKIVRNRRRGAQPGSRWSRAAWNIGGFLGMAITFFNLLWGFNYDRVPIETHLGLAVDSMQVEALCEEAEWAGRAMEQARRRIPGATLDSLGDEVLPAELETEVRGAVGRTMALMGYPMAGRVRGRMIVPGGWMLRIGISGIYNPFTGEGNVTGAQVPHKIPFTMAHEMAHGCGFGDEGTCNFIGMVACGQSDVPVVQYSGLMGYWSHLYNEIGPADPLLARMLVTQLDSGVRADQRASYHNYMRYHGQIAQMGNQVNNAYLHAQGVEGGIKSYDRVVLLRAAWRRRHGS